MNDNLRCRTDGLAIIKRYESFQPKLYNCPANHCTIGYGHKVHDGPIDGRESEKRFAGGITEERAFALLLEDCKNKAEAFIKSAIDVPLKQCQFDALCSLCYNIGGGNFMGSTLVKKLNAGDIAGAKSEFPRWNKYNGKESAGLIARRKAEAELFGSEP